MRYLVTGAAGFIGSHLCERLLALGHEVHALDAFIPYYPKALKEANQHEALQHPKYRFFPLDLRTDNLAEAVAGVDVVYHLAAMPGLVASWTDFDLYQSCNLTATQRLLETVRSVTTLKRFIYGSTSSVYGNTTRLPFIETDPCDRPLQPYAAAKRAAEILGHTYHYLFGQNFTALRFFTVYGPNGRPDMMAYLVADSITKGKQIPLYDGGRMYRNWTYVDDTVAGVAAALDRPLGYEIINLGQDQPVLLADFVGMMEELSGRKANVVATPRLPADVTSNEADISKARRLLDYDPRVPVAEGVRRFWEWYRRYDLHES